jgi:hypothetical protein
MAKVAITQYRGHNFEDLVYDTERCILLHKNVEIPWGSVYTLTDEKIDENLKPYINNLKPYIYKAADVTDANGVECELVKTKIENIVKRILAEKHTAEKVNI